MRLHLLLTVALLLPAAVAGQKKPDRPKVHPDFHWGAIPPSRDAASALVNEKLRLVLVSYHEGWSDDKISKELRLTTREIGEAYGALADRGLVAHREGVIVPAIPVIRERDIERIAETMDAHSRDLSAVLEKEFPRIATFLGSRPGLTDSSADHDLYAALVSGVLLGGMIEVFAEDKTFLPPPPRRGNSQYYGWLVEGESALAGTLIRETWDSDGYRIAALGPAFLNPRPSLETVRRDGFVLEDADARRFRSFAITLSRDTLLPFFKVRRNEILKAHQRVEAGKYSSFASFFGWYYAAITEGAVDHLVVDQVISRPASPCCVYALKLPAR